MHPALERCLARLRPPHPRPLVTDHVALDRRLCDACFRCVEACPEHVLRALRVGRHAHAVIREPERCTGCQKCVKACTAGALTRRDARPG